MRRPSSISLDQRERAALVYLARLDGLPMSREVAKLISEALTERLKRGAAKEMEKIEQRDKILAIFKESWNW